MYLTKVIKNVYWQPYKRISCVYIQHLCWVIGTCKFMLNFMWEQLQLLDRKWACGAAMRIHFTMYLTKVIKNVYWQPYKRISCVYIQHLCWVIGTCKFMLNFMWEQLQLLDRKWACGAAMQPAIVLKMRSCWQLNLYFGLGRKEQGRVRYWVHQQSKNIMQTSPLSWVVSRCYVVR